MNTIHPRKKSVTAVLGAAIAAGSRPSAGGNDGGLRFLGGHVRRRFRQFRRR
jgi:hypothetical protein